MSDRSRLGIGDRAAGLVLAGGASSRFGSEKAVARLNGRPLLAWGHAALSTVCAEVAVSARLGGETAVLAASLGLRVLQDDPVHARGPLAGVAAGLAWARAIGVDRLVTLPCDTPWVGKAELAALLETLGERAAAYAVAPRGPHPLCAVWRTDLQTALSVRLAFGRHPAVRDLLNDIDAAAVRFADDGAFRNANTPDDLAAP